MLQLQNRVKREKEVPLYEEEEEGVVDPGDRETGNGETAGQDSDTGDQVLPWQQPLFPMQMVGGEVDEMSGGVAVWEGEMVRTGSPVAAVERMPPLLSYEEEGLSGRSPSLLASSPLTEEQQVSLTSSGECYLSLVCTSAGDGGQSIPQLRVREQLRSEVNLH